MKKILAFLLLLYLNTGSFAQSLKKYPVGTSGCYAYFFCDPGTLSISYSEDSSTVYSGECNSDVTGYGIICVKLKESITDINTAEDITVSYLDYLKTSFKITSAVGYGKGHRLAGRDDTRGVIDYWTDAEKDNWKVKAWTDGNFICVLYAYSKKEIQDTKVDVFLNSLIFPVR